MSTSDVPEDDVEEIEDAEGEGVERLEAPESVSAEEATRADEQVLEELAQSRAATEDLFEPGTRAPGAPLLVSPHFRLAEFACKDAKRTPVPAHAVANVRRLARGVLEPLRAKFGACTVQSGYRTSDRNGSVGGKTKSWHLYHERGSRGVAADVTFARGTAAEWHAEADRLNPNGGVGRYPNFVHVDNRPGRARW